MSIASRRNRRPRVCVCPPSVACPEQLAVNFVDSLTGDMFFRITLSDDADDSVVLDPANFGVVNGVAPLTLVSLSFDVPNVLVGVIDAALVPGVFIFVSPLGGGGVISLLGGVLVSGQYTGICL